MDEPRELRDMRRDIISDLPKILIDNILERLPLLDVVRTSVLSRKWRFTWSTHPKLAFDEKFLQSLHKNEQYIRNEFIKLVNYVLLLHDDHILNFSFYIPNIELVHMTDIDHWILVVSRRGVKELTVQNSYREPYRLPSYLLSCSDLKYLHLSNCIFKPPLSFAVFHALVNIHLNGISFPPNTSQGLPPRLQQLSLKYCTGLEYLGIHAPELFRIVVVNSSNFNWQCLEISSKLSMVYVQLGRVVEHVAEGNTTNLLTIIENFTEIKELGLDGDSLEFLTADNVPHLLSNPLSNLSDLVLLGIKFNNLHQLACVFCLLRSSPKVESLHIKISGEVDEVAEGVIGYLEGWNWTRNRLQQVKLEGMKGGSKTEMVFLKHVLANSPFLKKLIMAMSSEVDDVHETKNRITQELVNFYCASPGVTITF